MEKLGKIHNHIFKKVPPTLHTHENLWALDVDFCRHVFHTVHTHPVLSGEQGNAEMLTHGSLESGVAHLGVLMELSDQSWSESLGNYDPVVFTFPSSPGK